MRDWCGNCNYQGGVVGGIKIHCLYDKQNHFPISKCHHWVPFLQHMSLDARVKMATELWNSEIAAITHREEMGINKEANAIARSAKNSSWWAILIAVISLAVSVLVAIFKK